MTLKLVHLSHHFKALEKLWAIDKNASDFDNANLKSKKDKEAH